MWFRNARPYKLPGRLGIDASELSQRLSKRPFQPCRPSQPTSSGWVPALSDEANDYVHKSGNYWLIVYSVKSACCPRQWFEAR